ncbi:MULTISPECIES: hypothetical protein [unclassified Rhodococcus (in: high G+C Gram-positive bacteria)]|uniref:Fe-S oxidoreductase n=1 Tax=Rhodococcus navarretei TaxID=3128981 RepID=A0ABU9CZI7_9NOCA|nr:hypothetical protein [Rhodococcus sp. ARC_M5]MCJ0890591.1 hypothetical protein [Rhodococcus sp. ARC_M5]
MSGTVSRSEQLRRAGRGSRQAVFVTRLALLYAGLWRGTASFDDEFEIFVCTGLRGGFGRGGTTFGGAYLTKGNTARRVLRHESVHADQWARFGLTFPFRYLAEEARHRGPANKYEREAGLADGGYRQPG